MPVEILRGFEQAFGCMILEGYGLSETSPGRVVQPPGPGAQARVDRHADRRGRDARGRRDGAERARRRGRRDRHPRPQRHEGLLGQARGHRRGDPDGWFRTGDLARVDEDGYFFIVDRKKDLIIRGGYNVYPREVEEVLYEHPAVAEAAVIGIPHDELGEEVGAAVQLKPGATATPAELRAFARERVAAYKYPRHVWLVPRAAQGPHRQDPAPRGAAAARPPPVTANPGGTQPARLPRAFRPACAARLEHA